MNPSPPTRESLLGALIRELTSWEGAIPSDATLASLGLDSLAVLEVADRVEASGHFRVALIDLPPGPSFDDLVACTTEA